MIEINKNIRDRKSTVLFSDKKVSGRDIQIILEAARWAASSRNEQPWRFKIATKRDQKIFNEILDSLYAGNIEWAVNADILIVSVANIMASYNNTKNRYAWHDVGMANAHIMLQANELGLSSHPMGGFDPEKLKKLLSLSDTMEPVTVIAIGYRADHENFASNLVERENKQRSRKDIKDILL